MNINKTTWILGVLLVMQEESYDHHYRDVQEVINHIYRDDEQKSVEELHQIRNTILSDPYHRTEVTCLLNQVIEAINTRPQTPREMALFVLGRWIEYGGEMWAVAMCRSRLDEFASDEDADEYMPGVSMMREVYQSYLTERS